MQGAAATSVGVAQAALEASIGHARSQSIAGQPLDAHQAVQLLIAEMQAEIAAARVLLHDTDRGWDPSAPGPAAAAFTAKFVASEMAVRVTDRALQVHGGHGYTRELPIERCYRDARGLTLHFMTAEMLRINIAQALLAAGRPEWTSDPQVILVAQGWVSAHSSKPPELLPILHFC